MATTPKKKAVESTAKAESTDAIVEQLPAAQPAAGPMWEQWLLLSCRHGEVVMRSEDERLNVGDEWLCRRCNAQRAIRTVMLSQIAVFS